MIIDSKKYFLWFSDIASVLVLIINYCCCVNTVFVPLNEHIDLCCSTHSLQDIKDIVMEMFCRFSKRKFCLQGA